MTAIFDGEPNGKEALVWEHEGNCAVRKGNWKLVCKYPGDWELYDIVANRTETEDVAAENPVVVAELTTIFDAWAARCNVQPWGHIRDVMREKRGR